MNKLRSCYFGQIYPDRIAIYQQLKDSKLDKSLSSPLLAS